MTAERNLVREIVHDDDYLDVVEDGCPADEYWYEADLLHAHLGQPHSDSACTVGCLAHYICEVWARRFGLESVDAPALRNLATEMAHDILATVPALDAML